MNGLEILDGRCTAKVELVLAHAKVTRATSFSCGDARKRMFDSRAFAERAASLRSPLELAKRRLQRFVLRDGYGSSAPRSRLRTLCAERTWATGFRVERDGVAEFKGFHFSGGTGDGLSAEVDREVAFAEKLRAAGANAPERPVSFFTSSTMLRAA